MPPLNPKTRFSNRVDYYVRCRPGYPNEFFNFLCSDLGLSASSIVADIGSGSGILCEPLLKSGNKVYGVEPNPAMRLKAEALLHRYPNFESIEGCAEATTLPDQSVDFITAGQAFHWFDPEQTRREFSRILRSKGWVVLVWNNRIADASPFLQAYEELLDRFCDEYQWVKQTKSREDRFQLLFGPGGYARRDFFTSQSFDLDGLEGRLLSSSTAPLPGHPQHEPMMRELEQLFDRYQENGQVKFEYVTEVYYGKLSEA